MRRSRKEDNHLPVALKICFPRCATRTENGDCCLPSRCRHCCRVVLSAAMYLSGARDQACCFRTCIALSCSVFLISDHVHGIALVTLFTVFEEAFFFFACLHFRLLIFPARFFACCVAGGQHGGAWLAPPGGAGHARGRVPQPVCLSAVR